MKVILRSDVDHVGRAGTVKDVTPGFARNFLVARGLAVEATDAALASWERGKGKRAQRIASEIAQAKTLAEKMTGLTLSFTMPAGAEGKLFGSVGKADVYKSLKSAGFDVERSVIQMDSSIKAVGEHEVELRLAPEVVAKIKVVVVARE